MTSPVVAMVQAAERGDLDRTEAVLRVSPDDVEHLLHAKMTDGPSAPVAARGVAASPGAASGRVCLTVDSVLDAEDEGIPAVFVRPFTTPADEVAMSAAAAIVTAKGGMASHAAVIARGWGIPAVVGVETLAVDVVGGAARLGDVELRDGDPITIDGSAGTIMLGAAEVGSVEVPGELFTLLGWADELRGGRLAVRANADDAASARLARQFGATGVGLCRTEHMFLGERLPLIQRAITDGGRASLDALVEVQVDDLVELLGVMDGLPVTVRLLDPPLHEFLPDHPELAESNPMLGVRGARLGVLRPELYRAQAAAVAEAAARRVEAGGDPRVQIMVPLVVGGPELAHVRVAVTDEMAGFESRLGSRPIPVGAMIETPRSALAAAELADCADFMSVGTNDLTQMTFGFCRDDIEAKIMRPYIEHGLLAVNPFETLDESGVGKLVADAVVSARAAQPGIEIGVCGEHGGDPASIALLATAGVDYVSCSPHRVPVARLAAAHAVIASGSG
ncbi:putative PEP-binding protein [Candidatus Poriferisocius sp.]|uniref:putative PEP-binding protein n=1 Tax=Candidatus Poriferisocius sp. TaxID=3101276 RepID=UPI003B011AFC